MTQASAAFAAYRAGLRPDLELDALARQDLVEEIFHLRARRNALILGHNYMSPLVYRLARAEHRGDSLALSLLAARAAEPVILFNGVFFMAETAKILNPGKTVLIADREAGCSLADAVGPQDVRSLRAAHPGAPVVTYINSYAVLKAESDFCCTSANALKVIQATGARKVIFLPDALMGANLAIELRRLGSDIELIHPGVDAATPAGRCEVHDQITLEDVLQVRRDHGIPRGHPRRAVLVHWECRPEVAAEADFVGSTTEMARCIGQRGLERVFLGTECEMAANLEGEYPLTEFVRLCNVFCRHMARIRLERIRDALASLDPAYRVEVDERLRRRALIPIQRMLDLA